MRRRATSPAPMTAARASGWSPPSASPSARARVLARDDRHVLRPARARGLPLGGALPSPSHGATANSARAITKKPCRAAPGGVSRSDRNSVRSRSVTGGRAEDAVRGFELQACTRAGGEGRPASSPTVPRADVLAGFSSVSQQRVNGLAGRIEHVRDDGGRPARRRESGRWATGDDRVRARRYDDGHGAGHVGPAKTSRAGHRTDFLERRGRSPRNY